MLLIARFKPELLKEAGITEEKIKNKFGDQIEIKETTKDGKRSYSINVKGELNKKFSEALKQFRIARGRENLLYQNSLISLISAVESFLSQIIHFYYETVPAVLSDKDKVLSFDDLKNFGTVEDARIYLIEKKVNDVLRGSFSDWVKFFRSQLNLSMSYIDPYMEMLVETCERRNLLVHNAGIVNSIYTSKVHSDLRKGLKKGSKIELSRDYLDKRINYFEEYSLLIAAELWKKLKPSEKERSEALVGITYEHLLAARWDIAEGLSYFQKNDKEMPEVSLLIANLNYWLCIKRQGRWDEIKSIVENEDFSAKGLRFQLALLSLLEHKDEFFKILPGAIRCKEIHEIELIEFPIFEEVRSDIRIEKYIHNPQKIDSKKKKVVASPKRISAKPKNKGKSI